MNKQHTLLRYTRETKIYHERCAETHKEIEMLMISTSSKRAPTSQKSARKEKIINRRKKGWVGKNVKLQSLKQNMKRFWKKCKWKDFFEKVILMVIQAILNYLSK